MHLFQIDLAPCGDQTLKALIDILDDLQQRCLAFGTKRRGDAHRLGARAGAHAVAMNAQQIERGAGVRHQGENADRAGDRRTMHLDLISRAADVVATRSSNAVEQRDHRFFVGQAPHRVVDPIRGIGIATR